MNVYLAARGAELQPGLTALSAFKLLLYFLGVALKTVDKNVFNLVNKAFSLAQKRAEKEEDVSCRLRLPGYIPHLSPGLLPGSSTSSISPQQCVICDKTLICITSFIFSEPFMETGLTACLFLQHFNSSLLIRSTFWRKHDFYQLH